MKHILFIILFLITFIGFTNCKGSQENQFNAGKPMGDSKAIQMEKGLKKATFAGGCFWCMESPFEKLEGVNEVISGYTGGNKKNPTYEEVASGATDHLESVQVIYNPSKITYSELLDVFWKQINPTDAGGQFVDRGRQYGTTVFYHSDEQKNLAKKSIEKLASSARYEKPIVTPIIKANEFYRAEEYHQDYYKKNPLRYKLYRTNSGRDEYLKKIWGDKMETNNSSQNIKKFTKPTEEGLRKKLTPLQYKVTQENGTERAFNNEYWDNKKEGIYVDVVSGEALFISRDKFKSGTGWPSFTKPLEPDNIEEKTDSSFFMERTEVRSKNGNSHLGHVFSDGPEPTGLRYCINSAALRFVPRDDLEKKGFAEYMKLFDEE